MSFISEINEFPKQKIIRSLDYDLNQNIYIEL